PSLEPFIRASMNVGSSPSADDWTRSISFHSSWTASSVSGIISFAIISPAGADMTAADSKYSTGIPSATSPNKTAPETDASPPTIIANTCDLDMFEIYGFTEMTDCVIPRNMLVTAFVDSTALVFMNLETNPPTILTNNCMMPKWYSIEIREVKKIMIANTLITNIDPPSLSGSASSPNTNVSPSCPADIIAFTPSDRNSMILTPTLHLKTTKPSITCSKKPIKNVYQLTAFLFSLKRYTIASNTEQPIT